MTPQGLGSYNISRYLQKDRFSPCRSREDSSQWLHPAGLSLLLTSKGLHRHVKGLWQEPCDYAIGSC